MHGTLLYFSLQGHGIAAHPLLIALCVAITAPVTNIFLMRAALFRARRMGQNVPPHVGHAEPGITLQSPEKHS